MLARIQNDGSGIDRGLLGARPTNAVVTVAHGWNGEEGLPTFAGEWSSAALGHDRHVAGVEVRAKDGGSALGSGPRAGRRQGVGLAIGVDIEGAVFLNDPAVVRDSGCFVYAVQERNQRSVRGREVDRDGRGGSARAA